MKTLSLVGVALTAFLFSNLNAQIVYKDITDGVPAGIDFNTDGTMEFDLDEFSSIQGSYITYYTHGAANNIHALGSLATENWDVPNCVAAGFTINATNNWEGQGDCFVLGLQGVNPTITFGQDEYLAVKFNLTGTNVYYGWIRFSVTAAGITYKDYAYNATPNTAIKAGDKGSTAGISSLVNNSNFVVYPNPAKSTINVNNTSNVEVTNITILDITGKEVKSISASSASNQAIDISDLTEGIYVINMYNNDEKIAQNKVIVE